MKPFIVVITAFFLLGICRNSCAQNTVITGKTYAESSLSPLAGAVISLKESAESVLADARGNFVLKTNYTGKATLTISFVGYSQTQKILNILPNKHISLEMPLSRSENTLSEIVVTGTGTQHYIKDAPVQTEVISGKALQELAARDMEDVLGSLSSSFTFSRGDMGSNLKLNGMKNDYILILIDGRRMNGDVGGQNDLSRINLNNIERIEMVKGAVSSLYGSDAIGGVINFITKKNRDKLSVTNNTRIGAYGDVNQGNSISFLHGKWNSTSAFDYKRTDGWQNTRQEWYRNDLYDNSVSKTVNASHNYTIDQNLIWNATDKLTINAHASFNQKWVSRPTGVPQWRLYDFFYRNQAYDAAAKYKLKGKNYLSWEAGYDKNDYFYNYTNRDYSEYFDEDSVRIIYYPGDRVLQTSQRRASSNLKGVFYIAKTHTLSSGMEYIGDKLVSPRRLDGNRATTYSLSAYAQDEWNITEQLNVTVGLRLGHNKEFGQICTPKISAMYKFPGLNIRANYSSGFRAPTVKELYYHYYASIMSTYKAYYGNADLYPQKSNYYSLNMELYRGMFRLNVTGYYNDIRNMIALQSVTTSYEDKQLLVEETMKYVNMAKAHSAGMDLTLDAELPGNIRMAAGYSYLNARAQQTDNQDASDYMQYTNINGTSHGNANLRVSWSNSWKKYKLGLSLNGRYQSKTYYISDGDAKAYQLWRFNTSHLLLSKGSWNVDVNVGVDNLFNYIDTTPTGRNRGTTSPGRTAYISLSLKFKSSNR